MDTGGYRQHVEVLIVVLDEMKDVFVNLTLVFEQSYKINSRPAMAVAHSLGNMVSLT